ncbi:MAG: hypothetical protein IPO22_03970 [Anaerolineales bacterium]|nr:hypothetical protein [Anaerolineales bacterium]
MTSSQTATASSSADGILPFNYGSNLVFLRPLRYEEAALAYDKARELGLPCVCFRYQFGPFLAYFHLGTEDLLVLTDYARSVTEMSEERVAVVRLRPVPSG